jgi:hypothetical protein
MSEASDQPPDARFEVRIKGHLDQRWAAWLDGDLTQFDDGTTLVRARVPDQAALHGLLNKLCDLGLPLISVTQVYLGQPAPLSGRAAPVQNRSTT